MGFIISICPAEGGALRSHPTPDAATLETVQALIVSMNSLFSFLRLSLLFLCSCQSTCLKGGEVGTVTSGPVGLQGKPNTLHLEATPDSLSPEPPAPFLVPLQPAPGGKHSCFHVVKMPLGGLAKADFSVVLPGYFCVDTVVGHLCLRTKPALCTVGLTHN